MDAATARAFYLQRPEQHPGAPEQQAVTATATDIDPRHHSLPPRMTNSARSPRLSVLLPIV